MPTALNAVPSTSATMSGYDSAPTPALALSDIMHHMSPSPVPPDVASSGIQDQTAPPDPLTEADVLAMRQRLAQMFLRQNGSTWVADSNLSSREKELVDMVLRLTTALPMDATQLHRQAETIANLTVQRDYIVREIEEERERWRAEREVWDRTAEALLAQRTKPQKSEDAGRQREIYESETRALRDRLHDTQRRLSHLEAELVRLKPLLLMQPYSKGKYRRHDPGHPNSRHGLQTQDKGKEREVDPSGYPAQSQDKGKGRDMDPPPNPTSTQEHPRSLGTIPEDREFKSNSSALPSNQRPPPPSEPHPPSTHHHHRRRSRDHHGTTSRSSKRRGANKHTPLSSDAYAEHLLLAAKRVGRLRATHVSGLMQHAEREKELLTREQQRTRDMREQERLERERLDRLATGTSGLAYYRSTADGSPQRVPAAPHTPKKQIHYGPSANNTPIVFVHTLSPPVPIPAPSFSAPHIGGGGPSRGPSMALPSNPPTPLDSLLDAARMMDGAGRKANGKGRALEDPESPLPKRRRVSGAGRTSARPPSANGDGGSSRPIPTKDRVRSALDVLADQAAAAFDDPEQSDRRAAAAAAKGAGNATQPNRGYEHGNERDAHQVPPPPVPPDSGAAPAPSGRTRPRGRVPPSSVSSSSTAASSVHSASSASGRPLRNAVKRHSVLSPEHEPERAAPPPTHTKGTSTRGASRSRGRGRANAAKARVISPPQARVIAPPRPYVIGRDDMPIEKAAPPHLSDQSDTQTEEPVEEHLPPAPAPPVAESETEDTESFESGQRSGLLEPRSPSQALNENNKPQEGNADPTNVDDVPVLDPEVKSPSALPNYDAAISALESAPDIPMISSDTLQPSHEQESSNDNMVVDDMPLPVTSLARPLSTSVQPVETEEITNTDNVDNDARVDADADEDEDADAEADIDEDQDAEGEQEDDVEGEPSDVPSRSKSPPPPDPPPPGPDSGPPPGNDESEPDADADAEGDMDLEEGDEPAGGGSHASGMQQLMQLQLRSLGMGVLLEVATAPMSNSYRSALKGKSRTAGGLVDMCAKESDRHVLLGKVAQVISLDKLSGGSIKWGKEEDILQPAVTLHDINTPIGCLRLSESRLASSWHNAANPSIEWAGSYFTQMSWC